MNLVCLNICSGGGTRWSRILEFVESQCADVVVFTEWRRNGASTAGDWAASRGMQWIGACDGATANGVFVASTLGFRSGSVTPGPETAGTLLRVEFESWSMIAAYFPQGSAKAGKPRYFQVCSDAAAAGATPLLIVGDLNTGNQIADKTTGGDRYKHADRFDALSAESGLVDLWRRTHGADAREWTWTTKKNGFRIDHAFGNQTFVAAFDPVCRYDHSCREMGITDHSALLISTG